MRERPVVEVIRLRKEFELGEQTFTLEEGELLAIPAGESHGVTNHTEERLLVLITMAPPP